MTVESNNGIALVLVLGVFSLVPKMVTTQPNKNNSWQIKLSCETKCGIGFRLCLQARALCFFNALEARVSIEVRGMHFVCFEGSMV